MSGPVQNLLTSITENYSYDPIYQLTQVMQGAAATESYSYDPVGNRLSSLGLSPWNFNSSNQLLNTPAATFIYDNNGNMLSKVAAAGTTGYSWDLENRLSSVNLLAGGGTVSFAYDPIGRRIQKTTSSGSTVYLYDGANIVAELNAAGAVVASYAQGADIDEPLAMKRNGYVAYYHADGLGSITSLTGNTGQSVATYTYDSFGNTTPNEAIFNPYRYTAREQDPETGLYYYRARYYDPSIGRFLNEDPVRFWGGIDFYKYVDNNPTNSVDPSGEKIWGKWCGPTWTGGRKEQYWKAHDKDGYYEPSKGAEDAVCEQHDKCYYDCRMKHPCDATKRENCMRLVCDYNLLNDMPDTYVGKVVKAGIGRYNEHPDAGTNEECGCKTK
jgi:RHS repeat-associated protein